jgi:hypothetical protein
MKNKLIIFYLFLGQFALAQELTNHDAVLAKKNEFSFGFTNTFNPSRGSDNAAYHPGFLFKRKLNSKNHFLRLGVFLTNSNITEKVPFEILTTPTSMTMKYEINEEQNANFSIAYEWQKYARDNKRLRYTYGLGAMLNYFESSLTIKALDYKLENGNYTLTSPVHGTYIIPPQSTETNLKFGGIAFLSLDYLITKRLLLGFQINYMAGISPKENQPYANAFFLPNFSFKF